MKLNDLIAPDGVTDPRYLKARQSFWEYCKLRNPKFYKDSRRHLCELATTLQALYEGKLLKADGTPYKKLMINIPPRHGKSYILTLFCEWAFGRSNETRIISVSYNETLASRFAKGVRDDITATKLDPKWTIFSDIFPATKIKYGDASTQIWSLEGQFFSYLAAGFGGTITGVGCSIGIIDDPIKNDMEAFNDRVLDDQWSWYTDTFLSRVEEGGLQIVNMTRWSTKDLCGRLLDSEDAAEWYIFMRPAYDEATDTMLCAELLSRERYQQICGLTSSAIAAANYQQEPVDIQGRLYTQLSTYDKLPDKFERIISYTDTADTGSDYLCSISAGILDGRAYVLDIVYTDAPMEVTEPLVAEQLYNTHVATAHIESNNGGRGFARNVERILWDKYRTRRTYVAWFSQTANKQARILSNATYVMQNVLYPADWMSRWKDYARAMLTYQASGKNKHDDAADATTGLAEKMQTGNRRARSISKSALGF